MWERLFWKDVCLIFLSHSVFSDQVLAGKDAIFVGEGGYDNWAELRFPSFLLPDVMLNLAVDCPCVLCKFS